MLYFEFYNKINNHQNDTLGHLRNRWVAKSHLSMPRYYHDTNPICHYPAFNFLSWLDSSKANNLELWCWFVVFLSLYSPWLSLSLDSWTNKATFPLCCDQDPVYLSSYCCWWFPALSFFDELSWIIKTFALRLRKIYSNS